MVSEKATRIVIKSTLKEQRFLYNVAINQVKGKYGGRDKIIISGNFIRAMKKTGTLFMKTGSGSVFLGIL
ncbi:MAG: hypothetical protein QNK24_03230 [Desulfuromusa sp.]|nr:hypothetical protein [Desulfuromusa sp.]